MQIQNLVTALRVKHDSVVINVFHYCRLKNQLFEITRVFKHQDLRRTVPADMGVTPMLA